MAAVRMLLCLLVMIPYPVVDGGVHSFGEESGASS